MRAELERLVSAWLQYAAINRERDEFGRGAAAARRSCADDLARILTRSDWIPVSERLPEPYTSVLITVVDDEQPHCSTSIGEWDGDDWCFFEGCLTDPRVVAWQELPAPYRAEGGGG